MKVDSFITLLKKCISFILDYQYEDFVGHPKMQPILERAVWLSVDLPGQGDGEEELPAL